MHKLLGFILIERVVDLDVAAAVAALVVEGFQAQAHVQQQIRRHLPVVFQVVGRVDRLEGPVH